MIEDKIICEEKVNREEKESGSEVGNCGVYILTGEQIQWILGYTRGTRLTPCQVSGRPLSKVYV